MTFLETWRTNLKTDALLFAEAGKTQPAADKIISLIGAAALWEIRQKTPDQLAALETACPDPQERQLLLEALDGWGKRTPAEALSELDREQKAKPALRQAIEKLLGYFIETLFDEKILQINNSGTITGANNVIGGQQVVLGDLIIQQYIMPKAERTCPRPSEEPTHFGGRDTELEALISTLKAGGDCAITALNGTGGLGKTTIARVLASKLYKDKTFRAVLWADVTQAPDFSTLMRGWANHADSAFTTEKRSNEQIAYQVKALLEGVISEQCQTCDPARVLMVLDDVWENGIGVARLLMMAKPENTTILLTTRNESVINALHVQNRQKLTHLNTENAIQLLQTYLSGVTDADLRGLAEALGGHPLAMQLAARRIKNESGRDSLAESLKRCTEEYKKGIPAGTPFVALGLGDGQQKEDSLDVSLYYSYTALSPPAQLAFRQLGALAYDKPFNEALLAALWATADAQATLALCDELRLLDLIAPTPNQTGWYQQHAILRAYAKAWLGKAGPEAETTAFGRYADHITAIAEQFDALPPEAWGDLDRDLAHIDYVGDDLARRWGVDGNRDDRLTQQAARFSANITNYVARRRLAVEQAGKTTLRGLTWLEMGLQAYQAQSDQKGQAVMLHNIGNVWSNLGEKHKALEFFNQALSLCRAVGDRGGEATTLNNIGGVWFALGEQHKALEFFNQVLSLRRAVGDRRGEAATLNNIGGVWSALGEKHKALEFFNQALPLYRAVSDKGGEATTLNNIGGVWSALGEQHKALEFFNQALPLFRAVGDKGGEAGSLNNIGKVWADLGEKHKALEFYEQALPLFRAVGNREGEATTLYNIGLAWDALGNMDKAIENTEQALRMMIKNKIERLPNKVSRSEVQDFLAKLKAKRDGDSAAL
jgi:tetratricopeptide (TPR) repeat protein